MLVYHNGDLLNSNENVICHQVNEDGYMGGGIALAIARRYPEVEQRYSEFCGLYDRNKLYGKCLVVKCEENKYIANCFSQIDFKTSLKDIKKIFNILLKYCKENNLTVGMPYKYGCGIASGNWDEVSELLEKLSKKHKININVYIKD